MAQTITVNSRGDVTPTRLAKSPNDVLVLKFDFALFFESATASTLTVTADTGLTVGTTSVASNIATVPVSGGDNGSVYDLTVKLAGASEAKEVVVQIVVRDLTGAVDDDYGLACC